MDLRLASLAAICLAGLLLAGCSTPSEEGSRSRPVSLDVAWGDPVHAELSCPCEPLAFTVSADEAGSHDAAFLEVLVGWNGTRTADVVVELTGAGTAPVLQRGFDARRILEWQPITGVRTLTLVGEGDVQVTARLRQVGQETPPRLLPDLVTLVPNDVAMGSCDPWEQAEQGAQTCLRLGNGVGNVGDGPVEVRLDYASAAQALAPLDGRFVQRVYNSDGAVTDRVVGPAQFHATHSHWHYAGLAHFSLHKVDEAGLRGAEVTTHHKQGFCFVDWGEMQENDTAPADSRHAEQNCIVPFTDGWSMGISPGFYDYYGSGLTDQYVDVAGVPDGLYELVSVADGGQTLEESDETNNAASVLVRLSGGMVDVLEERGYWYPREHDA